MKNAFWDRIAHSYDKEIFDTLECDIKDLIKKTILKYSSKRIDVCDIGCGIGRYLPLLGEQ